MLVYEDLIAKMKIHFPRWMDIRRKFKTSSGGNYLAAIGEQVAEIQSAIEDYKKDFFIDKYLGKEDEVLTYIYKVQIGKVSIHDIEVLEPRYTITDSEKEFYSNDGQAYYEDGSLYFKENLEQVEYSIDGFKSVSVPEKMHVWNIFDEFAAFIGLRRYQWESNKELLNRILAFSHNKPNSTEEGLKNAILNNLINIASDITADDIIIERPTPENLNIYYDKFETILDHLAEVNRDIYRTKRWDLDTWNFAIKSIDYIPHAWDVALQYYSNGVGFNDDLKVEIVDAEMKTNATIYFYKKTLEYINSYIKNNNIKETIKLDLVKHSDLLKPINVKYRITGTEIKDIDPDKMFIESYDYKIGNIEQRVDDIFDPEVNEYSNVEILDNSVLDPTMNYKIRFRSKEELQEMSIDSLKLYDTVTKEYRNLIEDKPGFERTVQDGVRCTLTKKYLSEKYHYTNVENAHKELDGFVISDVELPTKLTANIDGCQNEPIYYKYSCEEIPVLFNNIERTNCYVQNNSILSDTVDGEKFVSMKLKANSFSCKIHGAHKIMYSINNGMVKTLEHLVDESYDFKLDPTEMPQDLDIKIYLLPKNNKQCAITNVMYSKYEFNITTDNGDLVEIVGQKRLPNIMNNNLQVNMKTYIGFSPILEYIYIGTKVKDITYGDISFQPTENEKLIMSKTNCVAELEQYDSEGMLQYVELDYLASKTVVGQNADSYITINLDNFKTYKSITADKCAFESISYGSQVQHLIKIPAGVHLNTINIVGEYEKLVFKETVSNVLKRKGYLSEYYSFSIAKTNDNILVKNNETEEVKFLKLKRNDLISYTTAKIKVSMSDNDIQTVFIDDSINKVSSITNEYEGSFDYISFYPMSTKIYKAINEYNVISPVTNVPQIINTFDNNYTIYSEASLYYLIESLNEDFDVKFAGNRDYSIDSSSIIISKKDATKLDFDYESVTVVYDSIIGNTIEIPDSFTVNKDKIETAKFIISNKDLDIQYLNKHNDRLHQNDYIVTEIVTVNELMCNKLRYCNVEEIEEIYVNNENHKTVLEEDVHYSLFKTEGVINWLDIDTVNPSMKIFIKYNIKKPKYIRISIDELYEKVNYTTRAYELLNKIDLFEVANGENFNLSMYEEYKDSDLISVKCSNIGFEAIVDGTTLMFNKNLKNNTIAVKSGYYYLDGDEYYLFADENRNNIENIDNLFFFNVTKENKKLYLNQTTTNLIANSSLKANANGNIFSLDCYDKNLQGISKINAITTCENFNYWKAVGMDMAIVKGLNGSGIKFRGVNAIDGYSYLNISKHLVKDGQKYVISFYMNGIGEAFLGEERKIYSHSSEFNKQSIIEAKVKALKSAIEDNIYELEFTNDNTRNYYLIVKGNVTVDDIIVAEKKIYNLDFHTKNISFLNLDIKENIYANYETRLYLDDTEGAIFDGTESKDGMIINSSYIDWGFTKTKELKSYDHFKKCLLENIDIVKHNNECFIKTNSGTGKLTTDAIYIGNVNTIKNLMFKINDVMFDNMKHFRIKLLTSSNSVTGFKEVSVHLDNIGAIDGEKLESYIKLIVEMPPNKVINNIELFTEYLSDANNNPPEIPVISGTYVSKVLDGQYNARFIIKDLGFELTETELNNLTFEVRASKENSDDTVWTDWKQLKFMKNEDEKYVLDSRLVFEGYRYFQFRVVLKGVNASVKIKHLDLEVI